MSENQRWSAVVARDPTYDGKFVYCVKTTRIFCRPVCKARLARRANVEFFDTPAGAEAAGYRACKRCQPLLASYNPEAEKVKKVCVILDSLSDASPIPDLESLAREAGLTKHHFHRLFKRETGFTPRQYALSVRRSESSSVSSGSADMTPITTTDDMVDAPFGVEGDLYNSASIDPSLLNKGEDFSIDLHSLTIYYSILETTYGLLLIAFQNHDVCQLELGISHQELMGALEASYPSLLYPHCSVDEASPVTAHYMQQRILAIVEALENPSGKLLDAGSALDILTAIT